MRTFSEMAEQIDTLDDDWADEKARKGEFVEDEYGEGVKYDKGKPSIARLPSRAVFEIGRVFKHGAEKYDETNNLCDNNWRHGMRWSRLLDAALRHVFAFKQGEDLDMDSGLSHLAHAAASLMMLEEFRSIYPQGDDRDHSWRRETGVVLDIDGVIADFSRAFQERAVEMGLTDEVRLAHHWHFPFDDSKVWNDIEESEGIESFYLDGIEPRFNGDKLPVEPVAYLTHRPCSTTTTERWLFRHDFPYAPVHTVEDSKVEAANRIAEDTDRPLTFVDDKFSNFRDLNAAGHHCLLYDRPMNRKHDVGDAYRLRDLRSLKTDVTYDQK